MSTTPSNVGGNTSIQELYDHIQAQPIRPGMLLKGALGPQDGEWHTVTLEGGVGRVPADEVTALDTGGEYEFFVETVDTDVFDLSYHKAERLSLWLWLEALQKSGEAIQATIVAETRGGLAVDIHGIKGILSLMDLEAGSSRDINELKGRQIDVGVVNVREKKGQVVVSQRALTEGDRSARKAITLANLEVGQVLEGEVRRLANFGAFVDIGGIDGLLHVKDMGWKRVEHPGDLLQVGDIIQVKVLRFETESEKIALGTKQLLPDPWSDAETRYRIGTEVSGDVVGLTDFGAFVMLDDGIEGLVHISEMSWTEKVTRPSDFLKRGEPAKAWVLRCDIERRRLGLTLRNPAENPWQRVRERHPVGEKLSTKVTKTVEFGLFVDLGEGLEGLVHISDFSWGPMSKEPNELYSAGDEIDVMVLDIDEERGRANLGIKQLNDDLTTELIGNYAVGQVLDCVVTSIQSYGVFAELEPGLEGMIHVSELGESVSDPTESFSPGQTVSVTITAIDTEEGRISLGLHETTPDDADMPRAEVASAEESESETEASSSVVEDESLPVASAEESESETEASSSAVEDESVPVASAEAPESEASSSAAEEPVSATAEDGAAADGDQGSASPANVEAPVESADSEDVTEEAQSATSAHEIEQPETAAEVESGEASTPQETAESGEAESVVEAVDSVSDTVTSVPVEKAEQASEVIEQSAESTTGDEAVKTDG